MCSRKKKTSTMDDVRLLQKNKKDPRKTSNMLKKSLSGVNVSSSTAHRRLIKC